MDPYLGEYMRKNYPLLDSWEKLSTSERYEIVASLPPRELAWVVSEKMGNLDKAKQIWIERFCENEKHHTCPHCSGTLDFGSAEAMFHMCLSDNCSYLSDGFTNPWTGCNHGDTSDDSCGFYRWDQWDI